MGVAGGTMERVSGESQLTWEIHKEEIREDCLWCVRVQQWERLPSQEGWCPGRAKIRLPYLGLVNQEAFCHLHQHPAKGDLWRPIEGKTPILPSVCKKDQRDPQKSWKPARYQLKQVEKSHKRLDGNIIAQVEGKEAKLENHNKPLPWRWS